MKLGWIWIGLLLCVPLLGQERKPQGGAPQSPGPKTGCVPLSEMGAKDAYKGEDGGLYGGGKNDPPEAHAAAAKAEAEKIQPLDADGKPSKSGKVVLLSIGMSNTTQEFSRFMQIAGAKRGDAATFVIVDGAIGGQAAIQWDTPESRPWGEVEKRLGAAGVTAKQVQFVWIKQALIQQGQFGAFPAHAKKLQEEMKKIVQIARAKYPALRIAYLSSRIYAGYAKSQLNPEPYAYEGAFSMRWLIQDQIKGDKELAFDAAKGDVKAPLLLWGPYLWGDGVTPRKSDGLVWNEADFGKDGTHPSDSGRDKVAQMLQKFFKADPYAGKWFSN
jgi:lysophospholipase L1-like esterase